MATLKIEKDASLDPAAAFQKVKEFIQNDPTLRGLDSHYTCQFDEALKTCVAKGGQFEARLSVSPLPGPGSRVTVEVQIPFALMLMKGKITEMVSRKLEKTLAAT